MRSAGGRVLQLLIDRTLEVQVHPSGVGLAGVSTAPARVRVCLSPHRYVPPNVVRPEEMAVNAVVALGTALAVFRTAFGLWQWHRASAHVRRSARRRKD